MSADHCIDWESRRFDDGDCLSYWLLRSASSWIGNRPWSSHHPRSPFGHLRIHIFSVMDLPPGMSTRTQSSLKTTSSYVCISFFADHSNETVATTHWELPTTVRRRHLASFPGGLVCRRRHKSRGCPFGQSCSYSHRSIGILLHRGPHSRRSMPLLQ